MARLVDTAAALSSFQREIDLATGEMCRAGITRVEYLQANFPYGKKPRCVYVMTSPHQFPYHMATGCGAGSATEEIKSFTYPVSALFKHC